MGRQQCTALGKAASVCDKSITEMLTPDQILVVEFAIGSVIVHYLEDVILCLGKANLGGEDARVFWFRVRKPAGRVVFAAVVACRDRFVKSVELILRRRRWV